MSRHQKQIRVTRKGYPARVITFTSGSILPGGVRLYFVHRYNPPEFEELTGKDEGYALAWLIQKGWSYSFIKGGRS